MFLEKEWVDDARCGRDAFVFVVDREMKDVERDKSSNRTRCQDSEKSLSRDTVAHCRSQ